MALSSLTPLTQSQYEELELTPITPEPKETESGNPDTKAIVTLGGVTNLGDLAFIIADPPGTTLNIDPTQTNTLVVTIPEGATNNPQDTYWTLNMGMNPNGGTWTLNFQTNDGRVATGKWVFTKGKSEDDLPKHY